MLKYKGVQCMVNSPNIFFKKPIVFVTYKKVHNISLHGKTLKSKSSVAQIPLKYKITAMQ